MRLEGIDVEERYHGALSMPTNTRTGVEGRVKKRSFANLLLLALGATLGFLRRDMNGGGGSVGFKFALRAGILRHLRGFVFVLVFILIGDTALREEKPSLFLMGVCEAIIVTWRWDHGVS